MYIKELYIGAFGALRERTFSFTDGVNLIEGKNEAGKSTLCAFIKFIFYGLSAKGKNGAMPDRKRYLPFDGSAAFGTLTLNFDGEDYQICRTLSPSGRASVRDEYFITECKSGQRVYDGVSPCDAFLSMSEGLFLRTAYVSQLTGSKVDGAEVSNAIENLLLAADEQIDSARALKALDSARAELLHKNGKGGKLFEAREQRDKALALLHARELERAELAQLEEHLGALKKSEAENARLTDEAQENLNRYETAAVLIEFENADKLANQLCQLKEKRRALAPDGTPTSDDIHALIRLSSAIKSGEQAARAQIQELNRESPEEIDPIEQDGGAQAVLSRLKKMRSRTNICRVLGVLFILTAAAMVGVGGACCAGALSLPVSFIYPIAAAALPMLLGIVMLCVGAANKKKLRASLKRYEVSDPAQVIDRASRAESMRLLRKKEENERMEKAARAKAEQDERVNSAERLCESYGASYSSPKDLENLAVRLTAVRESCVSLDAQIARMEERVAAAYAALDEYDRAELAKKLGDDPHEVQNALDYKELKSRLTFGSASKENIRSKIVELEKKLITEREHAKNDQALRERVDTLTEQIKSYERRYDSLRLAYDKIEEAAQTLKEHISPSLAMRAGQLMKSATYGKYSTLWVGDDISLTYADNAYGGAARDVDFLSYGTKELAYIALRIALCELLSKSALPMIFDESFSAIDDTRLEQVFALIGSRDAQSIILTSQRRERAYLSGANIIIL